MITILTWKKKTRTTPNKTISMHQYANRILWSIKIQPFSFAFFVHFSHSVSYLTEVFMCESTRCHAHYRLVNMFKEGAFVVKPFCNYCDFQIQLNNVSGLILRQTLKYYEELTWNLQVWINPLFNLCKKIINISLRQHKMTGAVYTLH